MLKRLLHTHIAALTVNALLAFVALMATRVAFVMVNHATFGAGWNAHQCTELLRGSLVFDTSAMLYLNGVLFALMLLPCHYKERPAFHRAMQWLFLITNMAGVVANLCDAVYFGYTGRRSTITVFTEFANENNIAAIVATETLRHWPLLLLAAALAIMLYKGFRKPDMTAYPNRLSYYIAQTLTLLIATPAAIVGIRGSATAGTRPITISNANQYVSRPADAAVVLNTPFSLIRSIGKKTFVVPHYFDARRLEQVYTPVHPAPVRDSLTLKGYNIVILIVESLGKQFVGSLNPPPYHGYTPLLDSLVARSLTFNHSFANGRISMDAMPSILAGLPMMVEPFFLTPASLNRIEGLPHQLATLGYHSAFFHGGHNISMGFSAFAHAIGYRQYFGLDQYCQSPKYGGMDDFDGKWAIWDEPFLQYTLDEMQHFQEPFLTTVFTASSHHPFQLPKHLDKQFPQQGDNPMNRSIRYTDYALSRFFRRAAQQPWYNHTIFVITADHTNQHDLPQYATDLGRYAIPIIFFTPDGSLPAAVNSEIVAQQTDISPTLLHLAGYNRPYLAFGNDLLATPPDSTWAFNYNAGIYQLTAGNYMLQFDGTRTTALYDYCADPLLQHNLAAQQQTAATQARMETLLKAIIQQYMARMTTDRLTP